MRLSFVWLSPTRALTPAALLKTVRSDPGMTAKYYANRYFAGENAMAVNHVLWSQLKRHGKVTIDRCDGADYPPRWYPTFETPRQHTVHWHRAEDEDLSVLREAAADGTGASGEAAAAPSPPTAPPAPQGDAAAAGSSETDSLRMETLILHLVQQDPGRDIQHYIGLLPFEMRMGAPLAFKRLRESGLLSRQATAQGSFTWQ